MPEFPKKAWVAWPPFNRNPLGQCMNVNRFVADYSFDDAVCVVPETELAAKDARISDIESKLRDAVEALEFYGRLGVPRGCTPVGDWSPDFLVRDPYWQDQGKTARAALARIQGEGGKKECV